MTKNRYWQIVRGLAIIAVVFIHCRSISNCYQDSIYYLFMRNIINFPVPVFFFLAGYFCKFKKEKEKEWIQNRLLKLIVPYLIWSFVYEVFYGLKNGWETSILYYCQELLLGRAATPFYYVIVLIYFTLITPMLVSCCQKKQVGLIIMILVLSPILQLLGYVSLLFVKNGEVIWMYLKYSPIWIIFYFGGILVAKNIINLRNKISLYLILPTLGLEIIESIIWKSTRLGVIGGYGQYRITGFLYSIVLCSVFCTLEPKMKIKSKLLETIGDYSFAIFFMHFAIVRVLDKLINNSLSLPIVQISQAFGSIAISIFIAYVLKKILKEKSKYFGV